MSARSSGRGWGVASACLLFVLCASLDAGSAAETRTAAAPHRGIAVLASDIGRDCSVDALADFVQAGGFSPVIVDWAWITAHWHRTDFAQVNRLLDLLTARHVEVVAMYRPRFLGEPTVPVQVNREGKPVTPHGHHICFSSAEARRWGIAWGEQILARCPRFNEIIIYNPLNQCECPTCLEARKADRYGHYDTVWRFLAEARAAWQARKPDVRLGVVFAADPEFWRRGADIVDAARPFLYVTEEADFAKDMAAARALRNVLKGKMKACLAKITWGENDRVSPERLAAFDRLATQNDLPYSFWTFDTLFMSRLYDLRAVSQALGLDHAAIRKSLSRMSTGAASPGTAAPGAQAGSGFYTDEELRSATLPALFRAITRPPPGYHQYAGLRGLIRKFEISDVATQKQIVAAAIEHLKGTTPRTFQLRMQCCMLLGETGDERVIPALARSLSQDPAVGVRMAAAGALGRFDAPAAAQALQRAMRREMSPHVRNVLAQALSAQPKRPAEAAAAGLRREPETFLHDASQLLLPTLRVRVQRLPWPFPGGLRDQHVFNNYQQPTDAYIHGALDFIQPAATPVSAVDSGYAAVIATNYPQWGKTHHFFIVTPEKGGSEGWCYTHVDPDTYTFKVGDYVEQGQPLGSIVKFSVGDRPGVDHLHLHYVRFEKTAGKVETKSLLDPLHFFDYEDTLAPLILTPFHFVRDGTLAEFPIDDSGEVTVSGKMDVIVGLADGACDHGCNWGVPVVTFSITGPAPRALQKLVLDHRGELGDEKQTQPLYLSYAEKKRFLPNPDAFPRYHFLRITKTDGDGLIEPADVLQTWDTTARDKQGKRIWPDGGYTVTVYAWDLAGNRSVATCAVRVKND